MDLFKPRNGTPNPSWRHHLYAQEAMGRALAGSYADLLTLSESFYIDGAVITATPVGSSISYAITAGFVCFKGEVMPIEAHTKLKTSTQVIWLEVLDAPADITPVVNADGGTDYVMRKRTARFQTGTVYPAAYMALQAPRKADLERQRLAGRLVMPGTIMAYLGPMDDFDATGLGSVGTDKQGWAVCNGLHGTPDLRGRTLISATTVPSSGAAAVSDDIAGATSPGDTVGADQVTLSEDNLPEHTHKQADVHYNPGSGDIQSMAGGNYETRTNVLDSGVNTTTNTAVDVRQASLAVVYIMCIAS